MLELQVVHEFMYENFEMCSTSKNGTHFLARCPLCGDSKKSKHKKRFNLDYNNGNPIYHCWNCDESGSFLQIYSMLNGLTISESMKELFTYDPKRITQQLSKRKIEKIKKEIQYENHNWILDNCYSLLRNNGDGILEKKYLVQLTGFIKDRDISEKYKLFIAHRGDYKGRIIIPVYDENNDIIYFQARRLPNSGLIPKYRNPTIEKGNIVLNKSKFDKEKYIIALEGLIDAFMVGDQGTSCLGSSMNDDFLKQLFEITNKVILVFDNDEAGYKSLIKFMKGAKGRKGKKPLEPSKYAKKVKYFLYPSEYVECKDINNVVVDFKIRNVYDMIIENSFNYSTTYTKLKTNRALSKKLFQN